MKLSDIFNIDLSTKGGAKLYRKIMGKYNIPKQDSKQLVKEIRNSSEGGGSSKVKYYNCIDENGRAIVGELCAGGYIPYANVFTWDSNSNPLDTYIGSCKLLDSLEVPRFAVRHFAFQPISIITEGNRITFNTIEELFLLFGGESASEWLTHFKEITEEEFYKIE